MLPKLSHKLKLDDLDVLPITTQYDNQLLGGVPMYLGPATDVIPEFPVDKVRDLRTKYIKGSLQNDRSNAIYELKKWFLYPMPLPKFWKFDHDSRLNDRIVPNEPTDSSQSTMDINEQVPTGATSRASSRSSRIAHTGEFFDLKHYRDEYERNVYLGDIKGKVNLPAFSEFLDDMSYLINAVVDSDLKECTNRRLLYLENRFDLFQDMHINAENLENKEVKHRDFYNIRKVEPNMLLNCCFSARQLNEFIWDKLNQEPERVVHVLQNGEELTLRRIFHLCHDKADADNNNDIGLKAVDDEMLDWYESIYLPNISHATYTPITEIPVNIAKRKRVMYYLIAKTFLDFDNYIAGEYLADLFIKYILHSMERSKYQLVQVSVDWQYDGNGDWWTRFAKWVCNWKLVSYNIRWNVRIKRDYLFLRRQNLVGNFREFLVTVFSSVLQDSSSNNIELQFFLSTVCNIDFVIEGREGNLQKSFEDVRKKPEEWTTADNPPVAYHMYYVYAHLAQLNYSRKIRGQNVITLRSFPQFNSSRVSQLFRHLTITEEVESLIANLLLCRNGLLRAEPLLYANPAIAYLYYLLQIPVVLSPLSPFSLPNIKLRNYENNSEQPVELSVPETFNYTDNPFMRMHRMGFRVILSCNMVLFNKSYTAEPVLEEYSVAASIYLLNAADLSEFARNSVMASGFEGFYKKHWIGIQLIPTNYRTDTMGFVENWYDESPNTSFKHNVPQIRRDYRTETLCKEWRSYRSRFS